MMKKRFMYASILVCLLTSNLSQAEPDQANWMARYLLSGKNISDYELALRTFSGLSDPVVLPTLLKLTQSDKQAARIASAGVLWHYNTKQVRETLVDLTSDANAHVRIEAAKSLCLMKYTAHLEIIIQELKTNPEVRARALRALSQIGTPEAKQAVLGFGRGKTDSDRIWRAYALYRLGHQPQAQLDYLEKKLMSFSKTAWYKADPKPSDLKLAAKSANQGLAVRSMAAQALSRIGDEAALAILVKGTADQAQFKQRERPQNLLLRHRDKAAIALAAGLSNQCALIRLGAAQTAGRLNVKDQEAKRTLAEALGRAATDQAGLVRHAAMRSIAALGMKSQLEKISDQLGSSAYATRMIAAQTLGSVGDERAVTPLLAALDTESHPQVRQAIYESLTALHAESALKPLIKQLRKLYKQSSSSDWHTQQELQLCIEAIGATGDPAARRALRQLPKLDGTKKEIMLEVLAHTGSQYALPYFLEQMREAPPEPSQAAVRFFDSLDQRFVPQLKEQIRKESAMWIRLVLARTLYRLGEKEYGKGILWGLRHEDAYYRRLAAWAASGLDVPGAIEPLVAMLTDKHDIAWYATKALIQDGRPKASAAVLRALDNSSLRYRPKLPMQPFWENTDSNNQLYAKEVQSDGVWVLFAQNRIGGKYDLFMTWSADGTTWNEPIFTGLTSFADFQTRVPAPRFSLQAREGQISINLTCSYATHNNFKHPHCKTQQRNHRFTKAELTKDSDHDGLSDIWERARFTNPHKRDSDRDGLEDGQDKNPLARPAHRSADLLKVLAFSHLLYTTNTLSTNKGLLVVENQPNRRPEPEIPVWPGLVLHLRQAQLNRLWRQLGDSYRVVRFEPTEIRGQKASQDLALKQNGHWTTYRVQFEKEKDQWFVARHEELY